MTVGEARAILAQVKAMGLKGKSKRNPRLTIDQEVQMMESSIIGKTDTTKLWKASSDSWQRMHNIYLKGQSNFQRGS
mgnify:CR=1 FL=1